MTEQTLPRTPEEPAAPAEAAGPFAAPAEPPRKPLRERRVLRAVARWSLAVVVAGGLGAGTAAFVTSQERTDLPGLATTSDGRWDFPDRSCRPCPPTPRARTTPATPPASTTPTSATSWSPPPAAPSRTRS